MSDSDTTHHKFLERKRGVVESRLLRAIDELEHRRHAVEEVAHDAKEAAVPVGLAVAGLSVAATLAYLFASHRARQRELRSPIRALSRAVSGLGRPRQPTTTQTAGKLALSILVAAATELAKYGARAWIASVEEQQKAAAP